MASRMFLYWGSGSPPCMRAMIALEEKGFSGYPNKRLYWDKKEHKGEDVLAINPRGQLPTFRDGDIAVNESFAIVNYLETAYPNQGTQLLPENQAARALVLQRFHEVQNFIQKLMAFYQATNRKPEPDKEEVETQKQAFLDEVKIWEGYTAGGFAAGSTFSMADVAFIPQLVFPVRVGFKLEERFPNLAKYHAEMVKKPSVEASWPPHWKEGPGPDWFGSV